MMVGNVEVVLASREIRLNGVPVLLGSRAFDILELLVASRGNIVPTAEIMRVVWPRTVVDDSNIRVHVCALRKAMGTDGKLIATVPGRGYRLLHSGEAARAPAAPAHRSASPIESPWSGPDTPIYGRAVAVNEVLGMFLHSPLVTLVGPGGVGKTRLGIEVARALAEESGVAARFISLASITDASAVLDAVASALGVKRFAGDCPFVRLGATLADERLIVLLDNCEHVIEEAAHLCHQLVDMCPQMRIIATSRAPLDIANERVYYVPSLAVPKPADGNDAILESPAVQLILARVESLGSRNPLDDVSIALIADLCRRLDGIPLALEMVAARIASLGLHVVDRELTDRLDMLTGVRRGTPLRHQTLEATLDWSYQLLTEIEKIVLRRLGAFSGSFSLATALAVVADGRYERHQLAVAIGGLVSKSLLSKTADVSNPRFFLLATTRAYALKKLAEWDETVATLDRHAQVFLDYFERNLAPLAKTSSEWLQELECELGNVRSALDWAASGRGLAATGIALAACVVPAFYDLLLVRECAERARRFLLLSSRTLESHAEPRMRLGAAFAASRAYISGPLGETRAAWLDVLVIAIRRGDRNFEARALCGLWNSAQLAGEVRHALYFARRFAAIAERDLQLTQRLLAHRALGVALHYSGEQAEARKQLEKMLASYDAKVHRWEQPGGRNDFGVAAQATLARVLWMQGHAVQARAMARQALDSALAANDELLTCHVLVEAVLPLNMFSGHTDEAHRNMKLLSQITSRLQFSVWQSCGRCYEAWFAALGADTVRCIAPFRTAVREMTGLGFVRHASVFEGQVALLLNHFGHSRDALDAIAAALVRSEKLNDVWYYAELKRIQGEILQDAGAPNEAEACFNVSVSLAVEQGAGWFEARARCSLALAGRAHAAVQAQKVTLPTSSGKPARAIDPASGHIVSASQQTGHLPQLFNKQA
jgi:predicted ATPase/DNA-binding winged helix-turn-helix (wHTH) protein